jgi:hypothetical protein
MINEIISQYMKMQRRQLITVARLWDRDGVEEGKAKFQDWTIIKENWHGILKMFSFRHILYKTAKMPLLASTCNNWRTVEIWYWGNLLKFVGTLQFWLQLDKIMDTIWSPICISAHISNITC